VGRTDDRPPKWVKPQLTRLVDGAPAGAGWIHEESQFEDWMRGPPELAAEMMKPYGGAIDIWEVGRDFGNLRNNKPELLDRVALV
jgi:putative SOS response-associated peptidase YedK